MKNKIIISLLALAVGTGYYVQKFNDNRAKTPPSVGIEQSKNSNFAIKVDIRPLPDIAPPTNCPVYDRKNQYGGWIDANGDCLLTRAEVLKAQNKGEFVMNKNCTAVSGEWYDPYSNNEFTDAKDLQIDHIVPLKHAHLMGACQWGHDKQVAFANDMENLLAVYKQLNSEKSDKPIDKWIPPNPEFTCQYAEKWSHVKEKYQLASLPNERTTINEFIAKCQ